MIMKYGWSVNTERSTIPQRNHQTEAEKVTRKHCYYAGLPQCER